MELLFFRQEAMVALQNSIAENIESYATKKEIWVDSFFLNMGIRVPFVKSDINVPDVSLLTGEGAAQDTENAILMHMAFRNVLKPVQATDRRLWTALTHTLFYPYMIERWPVDGSINENGTNGTVTDRYFSSRGFIRNGISRLYWIAEWTYDDSLEDPYEYTRFLMRYQDLVNQVDGSSLCRNKKVLRSCLKILKEAGNLSEQQKRLFFEEMCKNGGVSILDALPSDILDGMSKKALDKVLGIKQITNGSKVYLKAIEAGNNVIVFVRNGKAYMGKTEFKSRPSNLSRLTVGKELELGRIKYLITDIQNG